MATFVPACIIQQLCHIIERQFWRDTNDLLLNNLAFKRLIKNWLFAFEGIIANRHISSNGQVWFKCWCWSHQNLKSLWCLPLLYTRFSFCQCSDLDLLLNKNANKKYFLLRVLLEILYEYLKFTKRNWTFRHGVMVYLFGDFLFSLYHIVRLFMAQYFTHLKTRKLLSCLSCQWCGVFFLLAASLRTTPRSAKEREPLIFLRRSTA